MKTIKFTAFLLFVIGSFLPATPTKAQNVSVNFSTFHSELSPHGRWVTNPRFGQVWIYNDASFRPYYSNGHWEYTNYGWSWESDYDWGWAPFHYGRWEYDPHFGWMWLPGYEWASAWVSWSSYDDYYGWAPLGHGVNINVSFGSIPYNNWTFIPRRNICEPNPYRYYVPYHRNSQFRNAVVINNYYNGRDGVGRYVRGPERREVERYTGNRIVERRINYSDRNRFRNTDARNNNNGGNNNQRDDFRRGNTNNDNRGNRQSEDRADNRNNSDNRPNTERTNGNNRNWRLNEDRVGTGNPQAPASNERRRQRPQTEIGTPAPDRGNSNPNRGNGEQRRFERQNNAAQRQQNQGMDRQQDNFPQRRENPVPQRQQPDVPQRQQNDGNPRRQGNPNEGRRQESQPAFEQRKMERRSTGVDFGTAQRQSNGNSQAQRPGKGSNRRFDN